MHYKTVKRILDFFLSLVSLIALSPLFALLALLIRFGSKGAIFFRQTRLGKDNRTFTIYKFRTMYLHAPSACPTDQLDAPDRYITTIGKFLRATSLDELPQLFNVLKGDMSLVGPRPFIFNEREMIRLRNKTGVTKLYPGLTGWAQINGRDTISPQQKIAYDVEYLEKMSFCMDVKILCKTIGYVIRRDGIREGRDERLRP